MIACCIFSSICWNSFQYSALSVSLKSRYLANSKPLSCSKYRLRAEFKDISSSSKNISMICFILSWMVSIIVRPCLPSRMMGCSHFRCFSIPQRRKSIRVLIISSISTSGRSITHLSDPVNSRFSGLRSISLSTLLSCPKSAMVAHTMHPFGTLGYYPEPSLSLRWIGHKLS